MLWPFGLLVLLIDVWERLPFRDGSIESFLNAPFMKNSKITLNSEVDEPEKNDYAYTANLFFVPHLVDSQDASNVTAPVEVSTTESNGDVNFDDEDEKDDVPVVTTTTTTIKPKPKPTTSKTTTTTEEEDDDDDDDNNDDEDDDSI